MSHQFSDDELKRVFVDDPLVPKRGERDHFKDTDVDHRVNVRLHLVDKAGLMVFHGESHVYRGNYSRYKVFVYHASAGFDFVIPPTVNSGMAIEDFGKCRTRPDYNDCVICTSYEILGVYPVAEYFVDENGSPLAVDCDRLLCSFKTYVKVGSTYADAREAMKAHHLDCPATTAPLTDVEIWTLWKLGSLRPFSELEALAESFDETQLSAYEDAEKKKLDDRISLKVCLF